MDTNTNIGTIGSSQNWSPPPRNCWSTYRSPCSACSHRQSHSTNCRSSPAGASPHLRIADYSAAEQGDSSSHFLARVVGHVERRRSASWATSAIGTMWLTMAPKVTVTSGRTLLTLWKLDTCRLLLSCYLLCFNTVLMLPFLDGCATKRDIC